MHVDLMSTHALLRNPIGMRKLVAFSAFDFDSEMQSHDAM